MGRQDRGTLPEGTANPARERELPHPAEAGRGGFVEGVPKPPVGRGVAEGDRGLAGGRGGLSGGPGPEGVATPEAVRKPGNGE